MAKKKYQSDLMRVDRGFKELAPRAAEILGTSQVGLTRKLKKNLKKIISEDPLKEFRFFPRD